MSEQIIQPAVPVPPSSNDHVPSDAEARLWETTGEGLKRRLEEANKGRPAVLDHMTPSGLRQRYIVELADGQFLDVETGLVDVLRWERHYKKAWFDAEGVSLSRLLFITWAALKRTGVAVPNLAEFEASVRELHFPEAEDDEFSDVDPTHPEAGDPSSV